MFRRRMRLLSVLVCCLFLWTWNSDSQVNGFNSKGSKFSVPVRVQSSLLNEKEELLYGHRMAKQNELYGPFLKKDKFSIELSLANEQDDTPIIAHQAYVRFIHVHTQRETYFMMLRRRTKENKMYTNIDFNRRTREQLELENGLYQIEILIEDPIFKEALHWDLGTIELFFDMITQDQEQEQEEQQHEGETVDTDIVTTTAADTATVQPSREEPLEEKEEEDASRRFLFYGMDFISRFLAEYEKDPHFQENIYVVAAGSEVIALFGLVLSIVILSFKKDPLTFIQATSLYGGIYTSCCFQCVLILYYLDYLSLHNAFWWGFVFGQSHFMCMNCILAFGMGPMIEREQLVKVTQAQVTNTPHTNPNKPFQKKHKPARRY